MQDKQEKQTKIFNRLKSDFDLLNQKGYITLGVFLQGSQNYGLDWEELDIDTKAIIVPTFDDFVDMFAPISTTLVLPTNEHIDIKDIRSMLDCFKKQNISFLEILFTEYRYINPEFLEYFYPLIKQRNKIVKYNNYALISAIVGTIDQEYHQMSTTRPGVIETVNKYGYDVKSFSHILRLDEFLRRYLSGETFEECLQSKIPFKIIGAKKGEFSKEEAFTLGLEINKQAGIMKTNYIQNNSLNINSEVTELLRQIKHSVLAYEFKKELL